MKIKKSSHLAEIVKRLFNVRWWLDYDRLKAFTTYLVQGFAKFFIPQSHKKGESFEMAVKRMNLTSKDLVLKQKALFRLSLLMSVFMIIVFGYGLYQCLYGSYKAAILSIIVSLIALVLAFRYHFWYFQIKQRKLGCSFQEWYRQGLMRNK